MNYIVEHIDDCFFHKRKRLLSPDEKLRVTHKVLEAETAMLRAVDGSRPNQRDISIRFPTDGSGPEDEDVDIRISAEEIRHWWRPAYLPSLRLAAQQIELLAKIRTKKDVPASIFLTGCDRTDSEPFLHQIRRLATEAGIAQPRVYPPGTSIFAFPLKGCIGSAVMRMTTEEFITQGVGFGLQKKLPGESEWEEEAQMICYYVSER